MDGLTPVNDPEPHPETGEVDEIKTYICAAGSHRRRC